MKIRPDNPPVQVYGRDLKVRMKRLEAMLRRLETVYPCYTADPGGYCPICLEKQQGTYQWHGTKCELKELLEDK